MLVATKGNYVDLVSLLLEHRPNLNALDKDGGTALTIACKEGYTEIATALLNAGAYVNVQVRKKDPFFLYEYLIHFGDIWLFHVSLHS